MNLFPGILTIGIANIATMINRLTRSPLSFKNFKINFINNLIF